MILEYKKVIKILGSDFWNAMKDKNQLYATQYTGVSVGVQPAGLGVAYQSENHADFQFHFDDFDV